MSNKNTAKNAGNRFSTQRSKARHKGKRQRPFPHEHNAMSRAKNEPDDTSEALATWQTAQQGPAAPGMGPY